MTPVFDLCEQENVQFLSLSRKEQKSRKFFHCNFSIKFFWLSVIYVKFQVFRAGIYVMRSRKYKNLTFELNTEIKFKNLIQGTHWPRKEKLTWTEIFQHR